MKNQKPQLEIEVVEVGVPKWYEIAKWKDYREENKLNTNAFEIYMTAFVDRVSILLLCTLALGLVIGSRL